ncbi:hypothetical protein C7974DRAFT_463535 [Boeremia exigua]|uniref:uncharacterized protein n=1 Tax=Boeremia exigua TaxID=749465 RepID=UPI001E8D3855|nr:uncharacterized protein C7974DRAFT_463535 [Boeremia exigua]KAH6629582.1 hypothetical protein C7974DRAFT_463535 [Boeremia exigua]
MALTQTILLTLSLSIFGARAHSVNTAHACVQLFLSLPGQIFFHDNKNYEESIASYEYIGTRLRPTCIARPKTTTDVATIVKTLSKFSTVQFAVRSGGHNTNIGFADIEDGITIDLSNMNEIQLQTPSEVVSVGPGARWQSVYAVLDPYNISIQGGRNGAVGVGGYLTGGGISFFSTQRGWACDSVVNFEVVLSSGAIVNANATSYSDLFAALKGGLNNFGIVTRFDLETFAQGPMWGGVILYPNSTDVELLETLTALKAPGKYNPNVMFTFGFLYDSAKDSYMAQIAMYHSQPDNVNVSSLQTFADIQPQIYNSIRLASPGDFAGEGAETITQSYYMDWSTTTFSITPLILPKIHESFKQTSRALTADYSPANLTIAMSIQSVPPAAPASKPNSLGFDPALHPEDHLYNIGIAFQYDDPAATESLRQAIKKFTGDLDRIADAEGARDEHLYLNYAGDWQEVLAGYGNESLTEMRRVSTKYDGSGMFQKQVRGGFKLFG